MRLALIGLCLAMTACAPVTYAPIVPPQETRNGDIRVHSSSHDEQAEHARAAAQCAQYGRVYRQRSGNEYECVQPDEAAHPE